MQIACNTKTLQAYGYSLYEVEVYGTGIVSGVGGIATMQTPDNSIYSLSGQRMDSRSLPAGIYVSGGKKMIRK